MRTAKPPRVHRVAPKQAHLSSRGQENYIGCFCTVNRVCQIQFKAGRMYVGSTAWSHGPVLNRMAVGVVMAARP